MMVDKILKMPLFCRCFVKVFRKDDFDDIDVTFMTPRQKVDLTLGWVGGKKKIIKGEITGFSFTINQDLSYDVTLSIAGAGDGLANADYTTLEIKRIRLWRRRKWKRVTATDICKFYAATAEIDTKPDDGRADYFTRKGIKIGLVNHQMEREDFSVTLLQMIMFNHMLLLGNW